MNKETLVIAFNSQKGGAGKSTFTILTGSYLQYEKKLKVIVIDSDSPQYSIAGMRNREIGLMKSNAKLSEIISLQGISEFEIVKSDTKEVARLIEQYRERGIYDVILVDMPGTINMPGIVNAFAVMDYIFCPITPNEIYLNSSLVFLSFIQDELVMNNFRLRGIYAFWNRIVANENKEIYNRYNQKLKRLNLRQLSTEIPASVKFNKELINPQKPVFISTFLASDKKMLLESRVTALLNEICNIMNV